MKRIAIDPRPDWPQKVEELGLAFHTIAGETYWDESAYYAFDSRQVNALEEATNELQRLCLRAVEYVIARNRFVDLGIPEAFVPWIKETWEADPPSVYGRFDFAYDGRSAPKLLEYNADTPTALLEAAVVQWHWLEERFPGMDQFNSVHERLIDAWKRHKGSLRGSTLHFAHMDSVEDAITVAYLRDVAEQAGIATASIRMSDIGWHEKHNVFVDETGHPMSSVFKLYPWEFIWNDDFGSHALNTRDRMHWIEPAWKMVLSNKGILPILWELEPKHPNLLEAYFDDPCNMDDFVRKPMLSREGANIAIVTGADCPWLTGGEYGDGRWVYQALAALPEFDGNYPVIGSWVIDGDAAGMGIREATTPITDNTSRFVPHLFEG